MTTETKKSYTARLVEHLEEHKVNKKTLELIKAFATLEKEKIEAERKETEGKFTWGKHKGRDIKQVFDFDKSYCEWALKSSYLRQDQKEIIQNLIDNNQS